MPCRFASSHASGRLICSTPAGDETENEIPKALDRSAPPSFIKDSNLSSDKPFVVSKEGEPTAEEMSNDNLLHILAQTCTDEEVNWLAWKCLGKGPRCIMGFPSQSLVPHGPDTVSRARAASSSSERAAKHERSGDGSGNGKGFNGRFTVSNPQFLTSCTFYKP